MRKARGNPRAQSRLGHEVGAQRQRESQAWIFTGGNEDLLDGLAYLAGDSGQAPGGLPGWAGTELSIFERCQPRRDRTRWAGFERAPPEFPNDSDFGVKWASLRLLSVHLHNSTRRMAKSLRGVLGVAALMPEFFVNRSFRTPAEPVASAL